MWTPISLKELEEWLSRGELKLEGALLNFWKLIKIQPQKWQETSYGDEGGGFWVVAIFGNSVIFYNDIEDGFNISSYETYGRISEYACEQSELNWILERLYNEVKLDK
ncbi:hypothetical protein [Pedobacter lusitanus]|uniref:hypothetical protein n=1 Tax=Pedobacter lusitanus TaxID=1503925 RepID=UPI000697E4CF|nr:hypothetical protein [Pedobacter lusitanus]